MRVTYSSEARRNLGEIARYIRERNPAAAVKVRAAILDRIGILESFPEIGRLQRTAGVRKLALGRYPYLIFYAVDAPNDEVRILGIYHAARRRRYADA